MSYNWQIDGTDSRSDDGYWVVVLEAEDKREARKRLELHLKKMDRLDLLANEAPAPTFTRLPKASWLVYSNVGRRY